MTLRILILNTEVAAGHDGQVALPTRISKGCAQEHIRHFCSLLLSSDNSLTLLYVSAGLRPMFLPGGSTDLPNRIQALGIVGTKLLLETEYPDSGVQRGLNSNQRGTWHAQCGCPKSWWNGTDANQKTAICHYTKPYC